MGKANQNYAHKQREEAQFTKSVSHPVDWIFANIGEDLYVEANQLGGVRNDAMAILRAEIVGVDDSVLEKVTVSQLRWGSSGLNGSTFATRVDQAPRTLSFLSPG